MNSPLLRSVPYVAIVLVFFAVELVILYPTLYWWKAPLALCAVLCVLVYIALRRYYYLPTVYRALFITVVPGFGSVFFLDFIFWQHMITVIFVGVMFYFFRVLITRGERNVYGKQGTLLPLFHVFFSMLFSLGLYVFLRLPLFASLAILGLLVGFYPDRFVMRDRLDQLGTLSLPFPKGSHHGQDVQIWSSIVPQTFHIRSHRPFLGVFGGFLLGTHALIIAVVLQLFLVAALLPIHIIVSTIMMMIVVLCVVSLVSIAQLGLLKRVMVLRYVGLTVAVVLLLLGTAQWT